MLWHVLSALALAAVVLALAMIAYIVLRRKTAGGRKLPAHILFVGIGTAIWGVGMGDVVIDHLGDGLPPEWSAAPLSLLGGLFLALGLYKMIEILRKPGPRPLAEGEHELTLPERNAERIAYTRSEMRVLFALAMVGLIGGFAATENLTGDVVTANREGCERTNVLRFNQAELIQGEIDRTESSLKDLKGLEEFREEIEAGQEGRKKALIRLRDSVNHGNGVPGKPYDVDCVKAYP